MNKYFISLIIPAKNEADSVGILYNEIINVLKNITNKYEIIFIDDGSNDNTYAQLQKLHRKNKKVKIIKLRGNFGKSLALQIGFENSKGNIIFTMDADLQDNPKEIPNFIKQLENGYDLVSGWKKQRHDPSIAKVIPSRIINFLTRKFTGITIHDTNCGFKLYKREIIQNLNLYGELYRFIPIIAAKQNFIVGEVVVNHRSRKYGTTKFGWQRGIKGILDLLTIIFLTGYIRRPGHFFGTLGLISFFFGFIIGIYIAYLRFSTGTIQYRQPLLFLGMLLMIIGIQLVTTGLLAEMLVYTKQKPNYTSFIQKILK